MGRFAQRQTAALLRRLATRLNQAADAGDAGAIHDLRVAIRRLSRGLRVFAPYYSDRSWKAIRAQLRQMMQWAGAVRDRDIAMEWLTNAGIGARAEIVTRLRDERHQANQELLAGIRRWKQQGVTRQWRRQLAIGPRLNAAPAPGATACRLMPLLVSGYFAQVRALLDGHPKARELHRIRLATKRFRYTLELFEPCYGTGLETRIDTLRKLQQLLGDVNDCVASWDLLSRAMEKSPERKKVHQFLREKAAHRAAAFRQEWEEKFDAPGREDWWQSYLKNIRKSA